MKKVFVVAALILISLVGFSIKIASVKFEGLKSISEAQLEILLKGYLGEDIPISKVAGEIEMMKKLIMDTGYFSDVKARPDFDEEGNLIVEFIVKENPVIQKVEYRINGPKLIEESEISSNIMVKEGTILNINDLNETVENIKKLYREAGYFLIDVQYDVTPSTVLTINIDEYGIWDIVFKGEGEEELDFDELKKKLDFQTLKDYYSTPWWLRWIKDKKKSYPKVEDVQRMLSFLSQKYYFVSINIKPQPVTGLKEDIKDKVVNLVFYTALRKVVKDGTFIKKVKIFGNTLIGIEELMKIVSNLEGKKVTNMEVLKAAQRIIDLYSKKGYMMTWIDVNCSEGELDFRVIEKRIKHIVYEFISPDGDCRIDYVSDTKETKSYGCSFSHTREFLIDDLVTVKPGDPLYQLKLADTYGALNRSSYFEKVDILPLGTKDSTQIDLLIKMKERKKKFQFMGAVSWGPPSEEDKEWWQGFGGQLSLSTTNPWGRGQSISFSTFLGFDKKSVSISYGLPRPFMLPMKLDTSISYNYLTDESSQSTSVVDYSLTISTLPIWNNVFSVYYKINSTLPTWDYTNIVGISHVWDSRDSALNPTKGFMIHESLEKGGLLPEEEKSYYKITGDFEAYIPVYGDLYLALRGFGGYVYNEKSEELVIPAPFDTVRGQSIAGEYVYRLSPEIRYSIYKYPVPVNVVVFYDFGNGTSDVSELSNFVSSTGVGVNIVVPMLGPIEVGMAYKTPLNKWDIYFVFGAKIYGILPGIR